jgi:hypothetical protein
MNRIKFIREMLIHYIYLQVKVKVKVKVTL